MRIFLLLLFFFFVSGMIYVCAFFLLHFIKLFAFLMDLFQALHSFECAWLWIGLPWSVISECVCVYTQSRFVERFSKYIWEYKTIFLLLLLLLSEPIFIYRTIISALQRTQNEWYWYDWSEQQQRKIMLMNFENLVMSNFQLDFFSNANPPENDFRFKMSCLNEHSFIHS